MLLLLAQGKNLNSKHVQDVRSALLQWFEERDSADEATGSMHGAQQAYGAHVPQPSQQAPHAQQQQQQQPECTGNGGGEPSHPNGSDGAVGSIDVGSSLPLPRGNAASGGEHALQLSCFSPPAVAAATPRLPPHSAAAAAVAACAPTDGSNGGFGGLAPSGSPIVVGLPIGCAAGGTSAGELRRRLWSPEDDSRLRELVSLFGQDAWAQIAQHFPERAPRQCRMRYINYLAPGISHEEYTADEDATILATVEEVGGGHWARVAARLPGRRPDSVRNRWRYLSGHRLSAPAADGDALYDVTTIDAELEPDGSQEGDAQALGAPALHAPQTAQPIVSQQSIPAAAGAMASCAGL